HPQGTSVSSATSMSQATGSRRLLSATIPVHSHVLARLGVHSRRRPGDGGGMKHEGRSYHLRFAFARRPTVQYRLRFAPSQNSCDTSFQPTLVTTATTYPFAAGCNNTSEGAGCALLAEIEPCSD